MKSIFIHLVIIFTVTKLYSQNTIIDSTFGVNGISIHSPNGVNNTICDFVESSGSFYCAVNSFNNSTGIIGIVKYKNNGIVDSTFGTNGYIGTSIDIGSTPFLYAVSIKVQSDGKIILSSPHYNGSKYQFALCRILTNGSIDLGFAINGYFIYDIGLNWDQNIDFDIQSDGKIIISGASQISSVNQNWELIVLRLTTSGTLDQGFGNNGKFNLDISQYDDAAVKPILQPDGKIVILGYSRIPSNSAIIAVRLNSSGVLDLSFGNNGVSTIDVTSLNDEGRDGLILPDGKILICGFSEISGTAHPVIIKLNTDGTLDNTFGSNGQLILSINTGSSIAYTIKMLANGKILVSGSSSNGQRNYMFATKLNPNGTIDNQFFSNGTFEYSVGNYNDYCLSTLIQAGDKILLAGCSSNGTVLRNCIVKLSSTQVSSSVGLSGLPSINFGNVLSGSVADHIYYFLNNTPNAINISGFQFSPAGVFTVLSPNGLTIPPHNQLPVSFFFYPNAIQNYSGSVTVSSDAPNSSYVIQLLGNGVAQNASKIRVFNKLDNNPTLSNESEIANNVITATTVNTVKVCADGSNATRVSFTNNASTIQTANIRFRMKSDPFGSNTDYSGWFINLDYSINGNTITAKFTHPKYLNINGLYRVDTLQVIDNATSNVVYEHPFRIYRAPVLMVHGLWGNQLSLLDLQYSLVTSGKYNGNLVYLVDYEITNASPFSYNNNVIWTSINSEFSLLRLLGYSAGKVDIVAHSMGGIISRIYLQRPICGSSPCYRNDIHKLITLNTPHSGTQVANYILSSNPCATNVAQNILDLSGMYWNNGAVADLQCNSQAISDINTAPNLNRNVVPCHSIITNTYPTVSTGTDENTLTNAIATCRGETGTEFNNILYAFTPNDLVVPTESQKGGLNDFSYYNGVMHTASPSDIQVMNKVALLLDENTNTSVYFDQNTGGYNPPVIQPTFKYDPLEEDPNNSTQSGQVTITSPTSGFVTSPGATIQIVISSTGGTNKLLSLIQNKNINNFALDTVVGNITFNYTIPLNATGNIRIFATGFDNTGYTGFDTADIVSMPTASLDSIRFVEDFISVPKQQNQPFTIRAFYNNGAVIDITKIQGLSYQLLNNALATVTSNYVTGVDTGFTVLSATYQGKSSQTYLKVYLGDNWVATGIDLTSINKFNSSLLVYPNPASDVINIAFNSNSQLKANVRISDNYGRIVKELDIFKCKQGINQKEILINNLSAGLYFCEVELDREKYVRKFIVTR